MQYLIPHCLIVPDSRPRIFSFVLVFFSVVVRMDFFSPRSAYVGSPFVGRLVALTFTFFAFLK